MGLIHGDVLQWTNNHLGWELGGTGVLGVGTGDRGLNNHLIGKWWKGFSGWGLGTGELYNHLGWTGGDWCYRVVDRGMETYTQRCFWASKMPRNHKRPKHAGTSEAVTRPEPPGWSMTLPTCQQFPFRKPWRNKNKTKQKETKQNQAKCTHVICPKALLLDTLVPLVFHFRSFHWSGTCPPKPC